MLSLLSECEIWSFHILRSSPCPFQCFTCLKVTCCHFISSLACGKQTLFSALVSPAKEMTKKTSAPRRLSSLMLLFQGHVAYRNFYPNRVLIPTLSSLPLKGRVGENTRKRLTISSFQPKNMLYLPIQFQTSLSQVIAPCSYPLASESPFSGLSSWMSGLSSWKVKSVSKGCTYHPSHSL